MATTKKTKPKAAAPEKASASAAAKKPAAKSSARAERSDDGDEHATDDAGAGKGGARGGPGGGGADQSDFGDNIRLGTLADSVMKGAGGVGALALIGSIGLGMSANDGLKQFSFSYLVAFMFVLALCLGSLYWVTLQHLVNSSWSVVIRRVVEVFAANMPLVLLLSLPIVVPIFMGNHALYEWTDAEKVHADHVLSHKAAYLNLGFFAVRLCIYFGFWSLLSRHWFKSSVAMDSSTLDNKGKRAVLDKLRSLSAPSMILVALTLTFASIDFVMSLDARWFSTMFGVYFFAGCVLTVHSFTALSLFWLQGKGRLAKSVSVHHFHDLGKMMFAFTVFWSYVGFSQFMLIWYANLPEETAWFKERFTGEWRAVSTLLLIGHFALPFLGLLSRHVKRHRQGLAFWAVWLLVMEYVDLYWLIMPNRGTEELPLHVLDLTCLVATVSLFIAGAAYNARNVNLVPIRDPRLEKSLAFTNL